MTNILKDLGLMAIQNQDELFLRWDHPWSEPEEEVEGIEERVRAELVTEVRRGMEGNWAYAKQIDRTTGSRFKLQDFIAGDSDYFMVRMVTGGAYAPAPSTLLVTTTHPAGHSLAAGTGWTTGLRDEKSLTWPGAKTDTTTDGDGYLVLAATKLEGIYESPEIPLGAIADWRLGFKVWADFDDTEHTIPGLDRTIDSLDFTDLDPEAELTEDELVPNGESIFAMEHDEWGNIYDPRGTWKLEWTVYDVAGAPGDYELAHCGYKHGQYVQFRLTLTRRDATRDTIKVTAMKISASTAEQVGSPFFDIRSFGAKVNGTTDDIVAINKALAAAKATGIGGEVHNPGIAGVTAQVAVPNRVWLTGVNSFASRIKALATFPTSTPVVRLGEGAGTVFNCRLHRCGVDCNSIAGSTGVYSNEIQEQSGCTYVDINGYRTYGIEFVLAGATAASLVGVEHINCFGSTDGHTGGIRFSSVAGQVFAKHVSVVPSGAAMGIDGILIDGGDALLEQIHVEKHTDGIHFTNGTAGTVRGCYGHSSVTNLIHLGTGCNVTLRSINAGGSTNILLDDARSITVTSGEMSFIQEYANNEIQIGPVAIGAGTQTAIVNLSLPPLAGVADELVTQKLARQLQYKSFYQCSVAGQTTGYFVSVSGGGVLETVRAYPLGTVVGTNDLQTLQRKMFAPYTGWQSGDTVMRFLDDGADHYYDLVVSDLAASRRLILPALDQNSTFSFREQAETFSGIKTFTAHPIITQIQAPASDIITFQSDHDPDNKFVIDLTNYWYPILYGYNDPGGSLLKFGSPVVIGDDVGLVLGDGSTFALTLRTNLGVNKYYVRAGIELGGNNSSGYLVLCEEDDTPTWITAQTEPHFAVCGADPADYVEIYHDATDARINVGAGNLKITGGSLDWSAEPAIAKVYTGSHSGAADGERWFEFVSTVMYSCIHWDGTDYKVALS